MENFVIKEGVHKIGKPCRRCGNCIRYIKSGNRCVLCVKTNGKERNKNNKELRKDEPIHYIGEPCKNCGNTLRYSKERKCVICKKKRSLRYYYDNWKESVEKRKQYQQDHKEEKAEYDKQYRKDRKENIKETLDHWHKKNPGKRYLYTINRRARKKGAEGSHTIQEWLNLCVKYNNRCLRCKKERVLTRDHIVPLIKGGTNFITNIQPLCRSCNASKGTKTIDYRETFNIQGEITI